jgi:hypothetical protein
LEGAGCLKILKRFIGAYKKQIELILSTKELSPEPRPGVELAKSSPNKPDVIQVRSHCSRFGVRGTGNLGLAGSFVAFSFDTQQILL